MRIALAQTKPVRGDVAANIAAHTRIVELASERGAGFVLFPELSLTGYEPSLAGGLAADLPDPRLDVFQQLSDRLGLGIAVGLPTRAEPRPRITLAIFWPHVPRSSYSKRHLHSDEEPHFSRGLRDVGLVEAAPGIALAICYELSVPEHARAAFAAGAKVYLCSVAKTAKGVENAHLRLAEIARTCSAPVLMANCVGPSGDGDCAGSTAAWNRRGELIGRLDGAGQSLLLVDTDTEHGVGVHCTW